MNRNPKPSRFVPAGSMVPLTGKVAAQADKGIRLVLAEKRRASLKWLAGQGWRLAKAPVAEGWAVVFTRGKGTTFEMLTGPAPEAKPKDVVAHQVYSYSEFARLALERGDAEKALGWAWFAGFFAGKSNVLLTESKASASRRKGKSAVSDEAYLKAIHDAGGPNARTKDIINHVRAAASMSAHYERIRTLKAGFRKQ